MTGGVGGPRVIACLRPAAQYGAYAREIDQAIRRVLDSGRYVLDGEVAAFERAFAAYVGVGHAVGVGSGTDALFLSLKALGVGAGDEVVTVSMTALATVAAVRMTGATPVLVDVDPVSRTMAPAGLEQALSPRTRAVIPVHLYGHMADMAAILALTRPLGVPVIEDCAQAHGAGNRQGRAGSLGALGCFSFYPTKNLGAIGDGGAIVTDDAGLAETLRRMRQYGWDDRRHAGGGEGVNSRLDELQAAILSAKLPGLDADNGRRRALALRYHAGLSGLPLDLPAARPDGVAVHHLYVIALERRDALRDHLKARGIETGIHYAEPAHCHGGYAAGVRLPASGLPETERLARRVLSLPLYPELDPAEVDMVITAVREFFAKP